MRILIFFFLMICGTAQAGEFYLETGVGFHDYHLDRTHIENMRNPLGILEMGFEHGKWAVMFEHISSGPEKGLGLNSIQFRYRWIGNRDK